jgi:hypothetical protein
MHHKQVTVGDPVKVSGGDDSQSDLTHRPRFLKSMFKNLVIDFGSFSS